MSQALKILSMGKYLPERLVTSDELEKTMGLKPGWILKHSGVKVRHFIGAEQSIAEMGAKALERALENAGMVYDELDLIINASGSYDYPIPDNSCLIQKAMGQGMSGIPSLTIDATCLSFVAALDTAACFLSCGRYQKIAIVSAESASKSLNHTEKESATLLGDGAAAAIVTLAEAGEPSALLSARMETYADGAFHTYVKGGGNRHHPLDPTTEPDDYTFHMRGPSILKMAFRKLPGFVKRLFSPLDFKLQEVDLFIPHQASKAALETAQRFFRLKDEQFINYLQNHGNCIAASIPMAMHDALADGRLKRGDRVCILGTGAGLSMGGLVLIY